MNKPLVSIVIPVYNGAKHVRESIDSALNQTYENCEILVVNDGSADNTEEVVLKNYTLKIEAGKIRYFKKENGGVSTALNMGIENMKGDYFSWLSHDDIYYPYKIETQIEALKAGGDMTKIAWGDYTILDEIKGKSTDYYAKGRCDTAKLEDSIFPVILGCTPFCAFLIHRSHFDRIGYFREDLRLSQDYDMSFRLFRNQKTVYIDKPLFKVREHTESQTIQLNDKLKDESYALFTNFVHSLTEPEAVSMFGSLRKCYYRLYLRHSRYTNRQLSETKVMFKSQFTPTEFSQCITKIKKSPDNEVCIFGAGHYGITMYFMLSLFDIEIKTFIDNDSSKHGSTIIDNIGCCSLGKLVEFNDKLLVIAAVQQPDEIIKQLKDASFPNITTFQEMEKVFDVII